jgi:hypothetical protein
MDTDMTGPARVQVVCTDPSHEGKRHKVQTFQRLDLDGTMVAGYELRTVGTQRRWNLVGPFREDGRRTLRRDFPEAGDQDSHVNLPCRLCPNGGAKVSARWDTLEPILDQLANAGVTSLELRNLAGIVSR